MNPAELSAQLVEKTQFGYALEYVCLDGKPFDFSDHNYLLDMYADTHPYQVVEKAAQMGASVIGMIKSFFVCDKLGKNVIYFFPTDEDVREFSKSRVAPIIRDSPHIRAIVDDVDSVSLRQVGRGFLYFRGMRSKIRMKSVPADMLVFDELYEVSADQFELADQRLNHSTLKWRYMLSTPTFDNYGIDYQFQKSDQRYWNLICKKCLTYNIMEKQWPDCVFREDELTAYLICRKCNAKLDTQFGEWVAERPKTQRIRGYHLCGLYSVYADLPGWLDDYYSGRKREEFMRSRLGLPWVSADQRVTEDVVLRCVDGHEMGPGIPHSYMGVDQKGDMLHVVIRAPHKITKRPTILFIGTVKTFNELDALIRIYDVDMCVIDGLPNQHSARDFSMRFPGRVSLCYYNDNQKGAYKWTEPRAFSDSDSPGDYQVIVNRTEALDDMFEEVTHRELSLPKINDDVTNAFVKQLCNLARINELDDDGGVMQAVWKRLGEDHFAHANSYSAIARARFDSGPAQAVVVNSPLIAQTQYSRRYEQGSRY
jgi:hypothetical protein